MLKVTVSLNPSESQKEAFKPTSEGTVTLIPLSVTCPLHWFSGVDELLNELGLKFDDVVGVARNDDRRQWVVSIPPGTTFGSHVELVWKRADPILF